MVSPVEAAVEGGSTSSEGKVTEALAAASTAAPPAASPAAATAESVEEKQQPPPFTDQPATVATEAGDSAAAEERTNSAGDLPAQQTACSSAQQGPVKKQPGQEQGASEEDEKKPSGALEAQSKSGPPSNPVCRQQQPQREKQPKQTERRQEQRQLQEVATDQKATGAGAALDDDSSLGAPLNSPGDAAATEAAAAAPTPGAPRMYSVEEMMRYAVKSQRPFHPRVAREGPRQGASLFASQSAPQSRENLSSVKLTEERSISTPETQQQRHKETANHEADATRSGPRLRGRGHHSVSGGESGASSVALETGHDPADGDCDLGGQKAHDQGLLSPEEEYFRSCFCEPGFRLVQRQAVPPDAANAPQGSGAPRRPRPPTGHVAPGAPRHSGSFAGPSGPLAEEMQPPPGGEVEGSMGVAKGGHQAASRKRPPRNTRASTSAALHICCCFSCCTCCCQSLCVQVSQHEESGAQGSEEAQPLWATQAHCTDPHGEKARSPQDQALGARGGPHDADGGLAAFSMGDIRMAEKAVESGMTLEGYFRRVKASGARGPQDGPSAAEANPLDAPKDPPPQQQHRPQEEGSSTLWNTDLAAHSATVGLGGVPLEADVEEEFSFLEETELSLAGDARGKTGPVGRSTGAAEAARARTKAAAAAAAAAAHAAAAAPSNPGAASVAAWFTKMLASPSEVTDSPSEASRANQSGGNASPVAGEGGVHHSPSSRNAQRQDHRRHPQTGGTPSMQYRGFAYPEPPSSVHLQVQHRQNQQQHWQQQHIQQQYIQQQHMQQQQRMQHHHMQHQVPQHKQLQQQQIQYQQMQQQLYMQQQKQLLQKQQALARLPRGQPLDEARGREAGRQLLSLIGVVPRPTAEGPNAGIHSSQPAALQMPPSVGHEHPLGKPAATAATDLQRQLVQRHYHLQHQQHMQQTHPPMQHAHSGFHFRASVPPPSVNARPRAQGFGPEGVQGLLLHDSAGYLGSSPRLGGNLLPGESSGERNLLKLLHSGGGLFGNTSDSLRGPPPPRQSEGNSDTKG